MVIYILTSGVYSDYQIEGVYSTKEIAEQQKALLLWKNENDDSIQIEEYELDKPLAYVRGLEVGMTREGEAYMVRKAIFNLSEGKPKFELLFNRKEVLLINKVHTEERERAIKVTNALRIMLLANDMFHAEGEKMTCPLCSGTGLEGENLCPGCKGHGKVPVKLPFDS